CDLRAGGFRGWPRYRALSFARHDETRTSFRHRSWHDKVRGRLIESQVRSESKADIGRPPVNIRYSPESRHSNTISMSALDQRRTSHWVRVMSALLPKADIVRAVDVQPKADS